MSEYYFELAKRKGDELDYEEKEELFRLVAEEAGLDDDEWEIGPDVERLHGGPSLWISIGSLAVGSAGLLLQLYEAVKNRDDIDVRSLYQSGGPMIFAEDVDQEIVEAHGATVIGTVEGDVVFKDDADDSMELTIALNKNREEHNSEEESQS